MATPTTIPTPRLDHRSASPAAPQAISSAHPYDFILKFIVVGDMDTGKSCLLHQFVQGSFRTGPPRHTIGVEYGARVVALSGKTVKLQIWDTAGQERFRSVTHSYYRGAIGALVLYDIAKKSTFDSLARWISDVRSLAGPDVTIIICGNKSDLSDEERAVQLLQGSRFAQEHDAMFLETSALNGNNVAEAFFRCARTILAKIDDGELDGTSSRFHGGPASIQRPVGPGLQHKQAEPAASSSCPC